MDNMDEAARTLFHCQGGWKKVREAKLGEMATAYAVHRSPKPLSAQKAHADSVFKNAQATDKAATEKLAELKHTWTHRRSAAGKAANQIFSTIAGL